MKVSSTKTLGLAAISISSQAGYRRQTSLWHIRLHGYTVLEAKMQQEEIYARLTAVMRDVFDDDTLVATPEMTASDVKDWDSASHITLVVAVEQEFGIKFKTAELEDLKTVGQLVEHIARKTAK
jgi:acyl carrier protein